MLSPPLWLLGLVIFYGSSVYWILEAWKARGKKTTNELCSLGFDAVNLVRLADPFVLKMGLMIVNISRSLLYLFQNFYWFFQGFLRAAKNSFNFVKDSVGVTGSIEQWQNRTETLFGQIEV